MVIEENGNSNSNSNINSNSKRANGFLHGSSSGSGGVTGDGNSLRTYKRRKCGMSTVNSKFVDLENLPCTSSAQLDNKMVKELVDIGLQKNSCEQVCDPKINCHSLLNGSDDGSYQHWRNALESICQSLCPTENRGGGITDCIREALLCNPKNMDKETNDHHDSNAHMQGTGMTNGFLTAAKEISSNGGSSESGHLSVSRQCEHAFFRLVVSRKFATFCKMLSENFHGLKIENFLDFGPINSRIKEGAYEHTPTLFSSDIQQIWRKVRSIGHEMVSLSDNMSKLSRDFCHDLAGGAVHDTSNDRKHELSAGKCDMRVKQEKIDASVFCTCRQCGERSDGRDCLVCDSCEGMFHVSCIKPAIKEIPLKSWYCAKCTASGNGSPHEDCVVCEQLIANCGINGADAVAISEAALVDNHDEESSDGIIKSGVQMFKGSKQLPCKVCGSILNYGEEFRVCEHPFCIYKYYHTRCLTNKELKAYGPRWYCPSCLCRVCLTDKDDGYLVMCDGCDHGYHIYCMSPPRKSIPKGKWFCLRCDVGIKAIRKVKKFYKDLERKQVKDEGNNCVGSSSKKSKEEFENAGGGSGGMDMLLSAARTLSDEN
ncbi:PHD finger protein EHD3 [Bienertia sinuspersici]